MSGAQAAAVAVDGGDLTISSGLLALLRPALDRVEPEGVVALLSSSRELQHDLETWCRMERHAYLGSESLPDERQRHLIARGSLNVVPRAADLQHAQRPGVVEAIRVTPFPTSAEATSGFAPRGARVESGGAAYPFELLDRDRVAPPEIGALYEQGAAAQWSARDDIPWAKVKPLPASLEAAVGQVMTFLAQNELSALYVPSRFIHRIHPAYAETAMFLATQLADEARHIDVFLSRARLHGGLGIATVTTSRSLLSLMELEDFTEASFLLSVLGEGTFLDLLRFVEVHAPDDATAEIARRTRADEARHVHFGMAHVRHALACTPALGKQLEAAVRRRAAAFHGGGSVPAPLQDALTILAAGGDEPRAVARGHEAWRELLHDMHEARLKRLVSAGFSAEQAAVISDLHTPNFM